MSLLDKPEKVDQPSISQATKTLTDYVEAESVSVALLLQDVIRVAAPGRGSADCTHLALIGWDDFSSSSFFKIRLIKELKSPEGPLLWPFLFEGDLIFTPVQVTDYCFQEFT